MRTQTREKLFSIFTSLTLLSQYVIGIFSYLPAPVYAGGPPTKITAKSHIGQKSDGDYTNGNVTEYSEGDSINFKFTLDANAASAGQVQVRFTENDGSCLFFDGSFALGSVDVDSGSTPSILPVGLPSAVDSGTSNAEWVQPLDVSFSSSGVADVNYTLKLSDEAGLCNGASQPSRLNPSGGV